PYVSLFALIKFSKHCSK
ncbi:hypothetical protein pipiens_019286, partial [Culex pipiens pipiens]